MGQDVDFPPSISLSDYELDGVHDFVYLRSTISDSLALNMEINKRIGKAATTMSSLTKRVWTNGKLTEHTKIQVYRACALSTLLYGNEVWTLQALEHWLEHVVHMEDGRIPKDLLYSKLAQGKRPTARPQLRYKDVCKRDSKAMDVDLTTWEAVVSDWTAWRQTFH